MRCFTGRPSRPAQAPAPVSSADRTHGPPWHEEELSEVESLLRRLEWLQREQALVTSRLLALSTPTMAPTASVQTALSADSQQPMGSTASARTSMSADSQRPLLSRDDGGDGADQAPTDSQRTLRACVESTPFEIATAALVVCYSICLGVDVHIAMTRTLGTKAQIPGLPEDVASFLRCAFAFLVCAYCVEMGLRMAAYGKEFFFGDKKVWNVLDLCILVFTILDLAISLTHTEDQKLQFLVNFRVLRFARFLRTLRIFSVAMKFPDLRKMIWAVFSCTRSFVWGMILMFLTFYFFAIFLEDSAMHILVALRVRRDSHGDALPDQGLVARVERIEAGLVAYWDGMYRGMLSLIFSVSGGQDWAQMGEPFLEINWFYGCVFTGFIFISLFGTLNVLVGVFVQKSGEIEQWEHKLALEAAIEEAHKHHEHKDTALKELFRKLAGDRETISVEDLRRRSRDRDILKYFRHLGIHVDHHASSGEDVFEIFDKNRDGELSEDEFVQVCRRLQGSVMPAQLESLNMKVDGLIGPRSRGSATPAAAGVA